MTATSLRLLRWSLVALCVGCGARATAPSDASLSGTWSGSLSTTLGLQIVTGTLAQQGATVTGTWSAVFPSTPSYNNSGVVLGTKSGASVSLDLIPSVPTNCPYAFTATLSTATQMRGTYASVSCTLSSSGTLTLTKQ